MLDQKVQVKIAEDAERASIKVPTSLSMGFYDGYIAGAEKEAERAQEIIALYKQVVDLQNEELNTMESFTKGYVADRERIAKALDLHSRIETALTKYNNSK